MDNFVDSYNYPLPSQGNIYCLSELRVSNGRSQVLFSSLKRDVYCLEYMDTFETSTPRVREVPFVNIPSGAEIISMCAFNKSETENDFVIGITYLKKNSELNTHEVFFNIYSNWEETEEFDLDTIAQNCTTIDLNFTPYHLLHTYAVAWEHDEIKTKDHVFLLSGEDHHVHVYREHPAENLYKECDYKEFFPELIKTPSPVMKISVYYSPEFTYRLMGVCCEIGYIRLTMVNVKKLELMFNFSTRFPNPVTSIEIYPERNDRKPRNTCRSFTKFWQGRQGRIAGINMVIVNSTLPSVIFEDVLQYGLSKYSCLPRIDDDFANVLTDVSCVDIDFDGELEIIIGSCSRTLNMYKKDHKGEWFLENIKIVPSPVLTHLYCDVNGDGIRELVVLTMKSLLVFEYEQNYSTKLLNERIKKVTMDAYKSGKKKFENELKNSPPEAPCKCDFK